MVPCKAMSSLSHDLLLVLAFLGTIFHILSPASCGNRMSISAPQGMLVEEKVRLGSTPPSCHNRCNACNPCTAVQVPTLPSGHAAPGLMASPVDDQASYNSFSNYKPLGWKCRCGDRLFDP